MVSKLTIASVSILLVGASSATALAAPHAGHRPASVPADFVVTPHGYFHPSCVVSLEKDETLTRDGKIARAGVATRAIPTCAYPHYDKAGREVHEGAAAPSPSVNGWLENANDGSQGPLSYISSNWVVPPAPAVDDGQTIFYFPGIEELSANTIIMQPVLAYNNFQWTITSWNCCTNGTTVHSASAPTSSGDTLYGYVQGSNCDPSTNMCTDWTVYTGDWTIGTSSQLDTSSYGHVMNWAFGGVEEVYGVDTCSELPATTAVTFDNLLVENIERLEVTPAWTPALPSSDTSPQCGYSVTSSNPTVVTLGTSLE